MSDRYTGYTTKVYGAVQDGHDVELEFDKKLVVLNRARLRVDGAELDSARIVYGDDTLSATLDDGTTIEVVIHSGMVGELTRAQIKRTDGSWADLEERVPAT